MLKHINKSIPYGNNIDLGKEKKHVNLNQNMLSPNLDRKISLNKSEEDNILVFYNKYNEFDVYSFTGKKSINSTTVGVNIDLHI